MTETLGPCPHCDTKLPLQLRKSNDSKLVGLLWCPGPGCGFSKLVDLTADLLKRGEASKAVLDAERGAS